MSCVLDGRLGIQMPRVRARPQGITGSRGPVAVDLAAKCGFYLDEWQASWLGDGMATRADGSWAASEVAGIVSRQNGKNGAVEVRELAGLVLYDEEIIHTSHIFPTTKESYRKLMALVEAHPDVRNYLTYAVASPSTGYEMRFRGGGRIKFIARHRTSGRGLTGDLLIFDEAQDLSDDALGALLPTISARPGSQAWYLGSAPNLESEVFHRIRERGRAGGEGALAYVEHSADPGADVDDREAWAQANPALGTRITEAAIEGERMAQSAEVFARERLSISPDLADLSIFPGSSWVDCLDPDLTVKPQFFAFDVNPERSEAGIVAAGEGPTLEVVDYHPGTGWLLDRIVELWKRYGKPFAVESKGPAGSIAEELIRIRREGGAAVELIEINGPDMARACEGFFDDVTERKVKIRANDDLDSAVTGAAKRSVGDVWVWGRKPSKRDISLLVAATVAHAAQTTHRPREASIWFA